jgi:dimethylhistidine N-methyltransferase
MSRPLWTELRAPTVDTEFREEVLRGLSNRPKYLPCRFFYDAAGSKLFEEITRLPEYYPTRVEVALLQEQAQNIVALVPKGALVVEFGSGSSQKTELLLRALNEPMAYVPIEISPAALYPAASRIGRLFPRMPIFPILGGFENLGSLKLPADAGFSLGFFPGSTIGNLLQGEAVGFLKSARALFGGNAAFLIGADLIKPLDILLPAYNDGQGVTAAFNRNILARINRELGGTFEIGAFAHEAIWNAAETRVEMHLRSLCPQSVQVAGRSIAFAMGETIHTENSHKYSIQSFQALARESGWSPIHCWTDQQNYFSLHYLA